jgi:enediyne biosynthesis thioesterase
VLRIQALRQRGCDVLCRLSPQNHSLKAAAASAAFSECHECAAPSGELPAHSTLPSGEAYTIKVDLYDKLLFHRDDFQVIEKYLVASAKLAVFQLLQPGEELDPLAREILIQDALIHGIQVCVPGQLLLPSRVGRIRRYGSSRNCYMVIAREIASTGEKFHYDVIAFNRDGRVIEQWTDLCLRKYRPTQDLASLHPLFQEIHAARVAETKAKPSLPRSRKSRYFEYDYTVGFKETNAVGNVYFTNHLEWQGRCREMFLYKHAPEILAKLGKEYDLVTKSVYCDYEAEIFAFDRILIRMSLDKCNDWSARMSFEYFRVNESGHRERFACGTQEFACVDPVERRARPLPFELVSALTRFANGPLS